MKVGFIGLGAMGKPIAINIAKAGFELTVKSRCEQSLQELRQHGARVARSHREGAEAADIVLACLSSNEASEQSDFKTIQPHGFQACGRCLHNCISSFFFSLSASIGTAIDPVITQNRGALSSVTSSVLCTPQHGHNLMGTGESRS